MTPQWDTQERIQPLNSGGDAGIWGDWSRVQQLAIAPPIGSLEEVFTRAMLSNPYDSEEAEILLRLTLDELSDYCSNRGVCLRAIQADEDIIADILDNNPDAADDDRLILPSVEYPTASQLPRTKRELKARLDYLDAERVRFKTEMDASIQAGTFYDSLPLIDWYATPPDQRTIDSPSQLLGFFGRTLYGTLAITEHSTRWAHIESVGARQVANRFGGDPEENEKTRYRQSLAPGQPMGQQMPPQGNSL